MQGTNGLAAQQLGICFTTGAGPQTVAPTVSVSSPVNQLGNVPVEREHPGGSSAGRWIRLTVNGTTIQVSGGGMSSQTASISFTEREPGGADHAAESAASYYCRR